MIYVKCHRSDEDSVVILSKHGTSMGALTNAYTSYQWWEERFSRVYPTGSCQMTIWIEYKRSILELSGVKKAVDGEFGEWGHVERVLEKINSDGITATEPE